MQRIAASTKAFTRVSPSLRFVARPRPQNFKFRPLPASLLGGPLLFSTTSSNSTTASSNTTVPLTPTTGNMENPQTNGAAQDNGVPSVDGRSKKMHSKVVSVLGPCGLQER